MWSEYPEVYGWLSLPLFVPLYEDCTQIVTTQAMNRGAGLTYCPHDLGVEPDPDALGEFRV